MPTPSDGAHAGPRDLDVASPLFRAAPVAITLSRLADGRFVDVNERYCELTGYRRDELIGRTSVDVGMFPDPAAREAAIATFRRDGRVRDHLISLRRKDGTIVELESNMDTVEIDGEPCILGFVIDVTARRRAEAALRQSEERFRLAFERGPVGITISSEGRWLDVNEAFAAMLGYRREELLAMDWERVTHPDDVAASRAVAQDMREAAPDEVTLTKRYLHRDGHVVWVEVRSAAVRDHAGRTVQYITHVVDVTQRLRAEAEARQHVVARGLARTLLRNLGSSGEATAATRRALGRQLADEGTPHSLEEGITTFHSLNIGQVQVVREDEDRLELDATGLLEATPGHGKPTCHLVLGYLEGVASRAAAGAWLGTELRCQSQGHPTCRFVLMARGSAPRG